MAETVISIKSFSVKFVVTAFYHFIFLSKSHIALFTQTFSRTGIAKICLRIELFYNMALICTTHQAEVVDI